VLGSLSSQLDELDGEQLSALVVQVAFLGAPRRR
jgi:hypothetical protein